jgi:hypothetical protein
LIVTGTEIGAYATPGFCADAPGSRSTASSTD